MARQEGDASDLTTVLDAYKKFSSLINEDKENFVNNVPWVHLDIAGTAWGVKNIDYHPNKGATGTGVRLLINSLENLSEWNH